MLFFILFQLNSFCFSAAISIDEIMKLAQAESELAQAAAKNIESIDLEIKSRDMVLDPILNSEIALLNNNQDAVTFARKANDRFVNLSLIKPFSTGTTFSLTGAYNNSIYDNIGVRDTGSWQFQITQSLWRDSFGRATNLRHQAEKAELISRKAQVYYDLQNYLVTLETMFWDLALAIKEEQIRKKNIEMGNELVEWTKKRSSYSAAEETDVIQAQTLVSQASIDLVNVKNQIINLQNRFKQYFPNLSFEDSKVDSANLQVERPLKNLIVQQGSLEVPQRLDAITSNYLATQAELETKKVKEGLKPMVNLYASYGQNGISDTFPDTWGRALSVAHNATTVGVLVNIDLNRSLVNDREKAARLAAEAKSLQANMQNRISLIGWQELERQVKLLKSQSIEAERLASLQESKVIKERQRFKLGRSTVFQLVTYELDAANSALSKYRSLALLRKTESQARLFTNMQSESL